MRLRQQNGLLANRGPERQVRLPLRDWFTPKSVNLMAQADSALPSSNEKGQHIFAHYPLNEMRPCWVEREPYGTLPRRWRSIRRPITLEEQTPALE
jgi:hypothetical protein